MKIAFIFSPKAKEEHNESLISIYHAISDLGHSFTDESIMSVDPQQFYKPTSPDAGTFFENIEKSVKAADICIFETTVSSLGLGHVIYMALSMGKPIITLYQGDNVPMLLSELEDSKVQVLSYTEATIKQTLVDAIDYAKDQADTRFNFFISPSHSTYLDWVAKNRRIPRSVYLRQLIKRDMEQNKDYQ